MPPVMADPLRILMLASEAAPFAKSGGLGDVVSALTGYLDRAGHDVRLVLPLYRTLDTAGERLEPVAEVADVPLRLGGWELRFSLFRADLPGADGASAYFVHCPELYGRDGLYTADPDEHLRFYFLTRAALESCQRWRWRPDVCHCNDWHTSLLPLLLRTLYAWDRLFSESRTLLTLHNIGFQGVFPAAVIGELGLAGDAHLFHQEHLAQGFVNFLETGLLYADALSTVSETYAREIQTHEQGFGLDALLRHRSDALVGIVNGIDTAEWSPERDAWIPHRFSAADLAGKRLDRSALLARFGLGDDEETPLLAVVSRLTAQKGLELLFDTLPPLLAAGRVRFVALGTGEARYVAFLRWLAEQFPDRAAFHHGYSNELAHWLEAGADLFVMPSRYEPCGLNQMYSQRYGTVPVVRRTGGLADTVEHHTPGTDRGTGFVFEHFTPEGLAWALGEALEAWQGARASWEKLMRRGMARDFSWQRQGERYVDLYRRLVGSW